jgi:hypothetical protein
MSNYQNKLNLKHKNWITFSISGSCTCRVFFSIIKGIIKQNSSTCNCDLISGWNVNFLFVVIIIHGNCHVFNCISDIRMIICSFWSDFDLRLNFLQSEMNFILLSKSMRRYIESFSSISFCIDILTIESILNYSERCYMFLFTYWNKKQSSQ